MVNNWGDGMANGFGGTSIGLHVLAMVFNGSQPMQWPNPLSLMVLMVGKQPLVSMECQWRDNHWNGNGFWRDNHWNGDGFQW